MAIKPCRECGKRVSTKAKTCPECGVRVKSGMGCGMAMLLLIGVGAVGIVVIAVTGPGPTARVPQRQTEPIVGTTPEADVTTEHEVLSRK